MKEDESWGKADESCFGHSMFEILGCSAVHPPIHVTFTEYPLYARSSVRGGSARGQLQADLYMLDSDAACKML